MTQRAEELISKINFTLSVRRLKRKEYIEDYPAYPTSQEEEQEEVRNLMFTFLKKLFVGCKIRQNADSFSLRLDGNIHRRANKLREVLQNDRNWKEWLRDNHRNHFETYRRAETTFNGGMVPKQTREDKIFIYVPFKLDRISDYARNGLAPICKYLEDQHAADSRLSEIYDEVINAIEAEKERRAEEKRLELERRLREYMREVTSRLYKPITFLQESEDPTDRLFAQKMTEWARENGKAPEYALPAGPAEMAVTGQRVKVASPPSSEEEGWLALPLFEGGQEAPEGYKIEGVGEITGLDIQGQNERSRNGAAPVIVSTYLYTEFDLKYWEHLLPSGYNEIFEASERLRKEAEEEIAPHLAEIRAREEAAKAEAERLELERAQRAEEERQMLEQQLREQEEQARRDRQRAREAQERSEEENRQRAAALQESLRQQLASQTQEEPAEEVVAEAPAEEAPLAPQINAGIYRNSRAIPLEMYVGINDSGEVRRFRTYEAAAQFTGEASALLDYHTGEPV